MRRVDSLSLLSAFLALAIVNETQALSLGAAADWTIIR
jgi:hypothetical protein